MSLGFNLPVHKLELDGNTLYFREATIADMKAIQELDSESGAVELFIRTYCNEDGKRIEVKEEEILELPCFIATEVFQFIAKINSGEKKS
jgi:hypothetical protein